MQKFRNLILLSPLVYVIHHFEEHIVFNFREWRLSYFLDNNSLSTEEVLLRLLAVLLIMIFVLMHLDVIPVLEKLMVLELL